MSDGGYFGSFHGLYTPEHFERLGLAGVGFYNTLLHLADRRGGWKGSVCMIDVSLRDLARLTNATRPMLRGILQRGEGVYWNTRDSGNWSRPIHMELLRAKRIRGSKSARVEFAPWVEKSPPGGPKSTHYQDSTKTTKERPEFELRGREQLTTALNRFARRLIEWKVGMRIPWKGPTAIAVFRRLLRTQDVEQIVLRLLKWVDDPFTKKSGYRVSQFEQSYLALGAKRSASVEAWARRKREENK